MSIYLNGRCPICNHQRVVNSVVNRGGYFCENCQEWFDDFQVTTNIKTRCW